MLSDLDCNVMCRGYNIRCYMARKRWRPRAGALWRLFGEWIKEHRERSRLKQVDVAQLVGIHPVQLSRIENGVTGTTRETVLALATALDLDAREALNRAGFDIPTLHHSVNAASRKLMDFYDQLPSEQQLTLVYFAETLWRHFGEPDNQREKGADIKQFNSKKL
jgi:transcriptional regulator with XRE-family HTH domain